MPAKSFLLLGPELGEKFDALNEIRKRLGPGAEETSFYAGETPVPQIVSIIRNGSLFSEIRLFIVKNTELVKKDDAELIASCLENPGENTTLVLVSDETKVDKRLEDAVPKDNRRVFWELFENKKNEWVASFFRRGNYRIDGDAVQTILEMVENNTDALRRECSRLALFLGKENVITSAAVEQCLSHTREESAFTLFAAVARGNLSGGLEIGRALLGAKQSVHAVLAGLVSCFRKLRDYLALRKTAEASHPGASISDFELKKIGLGSLKIRSDYVEAARRFSGADAPLALIGEYEYLFRIHSPGAVFEEILMDELVYKLTAGVK